MILWAVFLRSNIMLVRYVVKTHINVKGRKRVRRRGTERWFCPISSSSWVLTGAQVTFFVNSTLLYQCSFTYRPSLLCPVFIYNMPSQKCFLIQHYTSVTAYPLDTSIVVVIDTQNTDPRVLYLIALWRKPRNYLKMTESESTFWNKNLVLISRQLTLVYLHITNYKWYNMAFS